MDSRNLRGAALAVAIVTPNVLNAAPVRSESPEDDVQIFAQNETVTPKRTMKQAQPANAERIRAQIRTELLRMTPAQKQKLGGDRARIDALAVQQIAISKCCHTFSHGVGCQGTSGATQGITCCAVTLAAP